MLQPSRSGMAPFVVVIESKLRSLCSRSLCSDSSLVSRFSSESSLTLLFETGEFDILVSELLSEPLFLVRSLSYPDSSVDRFRGQGFSVLSIFTLGVSILGFSSILVFFFFFSLFLHSVD